VSLLLLRVALTAHAAAALCQPVLAGLFLTGSIAAITAHALVATVLAALCLASTVVAAFFVLAARGPVVALAVPAVLTLAEGFQIGMGYQRQLQIHIPLGVAIVMTALALAVWVWTPSARRTR
jgi:hypothetical protein